MPEGGFGMKHNGRTLSGPLGRLTNNQWGHALAKVGRRHFQSTVSRDIHHAYVAWHQRKYGRPAPTVPGDEIEYPYEFVGWAITCQREGWVA